MLRHTRNAILHTCAEHRLLRPSHHRCVYVYVCVRVCEGVCALVGGEWVGIWGSGRVVVKADGGVRERVVRV